MYKLKIILLTTWINCICLGVMAQDIGSMFQERPDKRKNATYFSDGLQSKYRDDTDGAISNFEQALRFWPNDHASMFELSEQYYNVGRIEDAFNMIQKAAQLDPDNKWYQLRLGLFYRNLDLYDDFIKLYEGLTIGKTYYVYETDAQGNKLEVGAEVEGYTVTDLGGSATVGRIEVDPVNVDVENTKYIGSLSITKVVKLDNIDLSGQNVSAEDKALANGNYMFSISGPKSGEVVPTPPIKWVQITVSNGVATSYRIASDQAGISTAEPTDNGTALVDGLVPGDYVITETNPGELVLTAITNGNNINGDLETSSITVTVTAGTTAAAAAQATFTNTAYKTTINIEKVDAKAETITITKDGKSTTTMWKWRRQPRETATTALRVANSPSALWCPANTRSSRP